MTDRRGGPHPGPELEERLTALAVRDQRRIRRQLAAARKRRGPARAAAVAAVTATVEDAERRLAERLAAIPRPEYPPELPITERKDEILAAIREHQVVIVAGETGSGKSTQLPKICLELGLGVRGMIGHTQPRRLAARTVAERVAEELGTTVGEAVGYTVRFTDRAGDGTYLKLMTDGILLAEIQRDRDLTRYDTLIVDEAHERSLNIDFILGYLKQLLPRRPDLRVIVTSATIDTERFSRHFDGAPVVEVSGRTYPVEVRYRPVVDDADDTGRDQIQAIGDAVLELGREGPGDILVFLSGEREIRDTADALKGLNLRDTELLPLYARLSAADQHRVFSGHRGRRVVLATNVAETSLTVPGIRYVIDAGTARISRYSRRTKVQRLPIEAISQAAANQRAGRCGRVAPGICIRLYAEEDFDGRPEYTEPEILRTNLASVILQMAAIGLGDIAAFPFVDPPDARNIKDGIALLEELGALDPEQDDARKRLTPLGRRLAQLPLDPRLGRMVLEADRHGCVHEVMVIAAGLAIQDPRERPSGKQQIADEHHRRFAGPDSDFVGFLNLWTHLRERQKVLSSNQFRKECKAQYLNHLRIREWQDVYSQLRQVTRGMGVRMNSQPGDPHKVHLSLLAGLLSHVGVKDAEKQEYLGARNARFAIAPGSALFKKAPKWVMAAELVETNRLWGRVVARIQPEWAEQLGGHLVKRSYSEPRWDRRRAAAVADERVTLYGLPIVTGRRVDLGRVDPVLARELFIHHALVEGDWDASHAFLEHNRGLAEQVRALEDRVRRRDILVDDEALFDLYDRRVGERATSGRHFDSWWKKARVSDPDRLTFTVDELVAAGAGRIRFADYPDEWHQGDVTLPLSYAFDPGAFYDGVTVHIPLPLLNQVGDAGFDWQVPGLREELVAALIRTLPKQVRRAVVPVTDHARAFLAGTGPDDGDLLDLLARFLSRATGVAVRPHHFRPDQLPGHLHVTFRVEGDDGTLLAEGPDLGALRDQLSGSVRSSIARAAAGMERTGITTWDIGALPRVVEAEHAGHKVRGFPALVDEGATAGVRVFATRADQQRAMWAGTRRLLLLSLPSPTRTLQKRLSNRTKLALAHRPHHSAADMLADCVTCALDHAITRNGGPAWDEAAFDALRAGVRDVLADLVVEVVAGVGEILEVAARVEQRITAPAGPAFHPSLDDMATQLAGLVHPGFVAATGYERLPDLQRYLRAMERRLDRLPKDALADQRRMQGVQRLEEEYRDLLAALAPTPELGEIGWMLQELRVSVFAQSVGTPMPVSEERVSRALDRAAAAQGAALEAAPN